MQSDVPLKTLHIPGYSIEIENNNEKRRVATYVSNRIKYRRRKDLETPNYHTIILDVGSTIKYRIINIYRPFHPLNMTEREFFQAQLTSLNNNTTSYTIILGDLNLDLNKENDGNYGKRNLLNNMTNTLDHHNLEQMVHEDTWSRIINGSN